MKFIFTYTGKIKNLELSACASGLFYFLFFPCLLSAQSPGGVSGELRLWLRAGSSAFKDSGITNAMNNDSVQQWNDQSGNSFNATNAGNIQYSALSAGYTTGVKPIYKTGNSNFYSSLNFGGNNTVSELNLGSNFPSASSAKTGYTLIVIATPSKANSRNFITDVGAYAKTDIGLMLGTDGAGYFNPTNFGGAGTNSTATTASTSTLLRFVTTFGSSLNSTLYANGAKIFGSITSVTSIDTNDISWASTYSAGNEPTEYTPFVIGRMAKAGSGNYTSRYFTGDINEVIVYSSSLAASDIVKIESYLALKYGVTLGTASNVMNYYASDWNGTTGTKIWPADTTYQNDVFGIGRDNNSGLMQSQANSMNSGSGNGAGQSGKGNLVLSTGSTLSDKQFVAIGNDAGSLTEQTILSGQAPTMVIGSKRVARTWKVMNTGSVGAINLSIDMTGLSFSGGNNATYYALMVNNSSSNFGAGVTNLISASSISGNLINFNGINLSNNNVFTLITSYNTIILPLQWLNFNAYSIQGKALLEWSTMDEATILQFDIEQAIDSISFAKIGSVSAVNSLNTTSYSFSQANPALCENYYRVKEVSIDGSYRYSETKELSFGINSNQIKILKNPVLSDQVDISISSTSNKKACVRIVDMNGKCILNTNLILQKGDNREIFTAPTNAGVYMIQLLSSGTTDMIKFVRVK
jgi:type IX secretion system substrate protein